MGVWRGLYIWEWWKHGRSGEREIWACVQSTHSSQKRKYLMLAYGQWCFMVWKPGLLLSGWKSASRAVTGGGCATWRVYHWEIQWVAWRLLRGMESSRLWMCREPGDSGGLVMYIAGKREKCWRLLVTKNGSGEDIERPGWGQWGKTLGSWELWHILHTTVKNGRTPSEVLTPWNGNVWW